MARPAHAGEYCTCYRRENHSGANVAKATRSDWIIENLKAATGDLLTPEQMLRISGDGTAENPGIDANNRLIWGQVFLWPEADISRSKPFK